MSENLAKKTIHGLGWTYVSSGINILAQILFTAISARLLDPNIFGLIAMGNVVISFGNYFSQMGISQAIIQKDKIDESDITVSFITSVLLGGGMFFLFYLTAPIINEYFKSDDVVSIIRFLSVLFLINGFSVTSISLLRRELRFKELAAAEIVSFFIGYILIGLPLAYFGLGIYSLILASLLKAGIMLIVSYYYIRHPLALKFKYERFVILYSYGFKISAIGFLQFLNSSFDSLIIGRFLGAQTLGLYNRAYMLIKTPSTYFYTNISKVLFPAISKIQNDDDKVIKAFQDILIVFSIILLPSVLFVSYYSREIILLLLGPNWVDGVNVLRILSYNIIFLAAANIVGVIFQAQARLNVFFRIELVYTILLLLSLLFFVEYGLVAVSVSLLSSSFIRCLLFLAKLRKTINYSFLTILKYFSLSLIISVLILTIQGIQNHYLTPGSLAVVFNWLSFILFYLTVLIITIKFFKFNEIINMLMIFRDKTDNVQIKKIVNKILN